ncbi:Gldg family protein [Sphingobacterium sp. UT-1RO-CII-1]|uniref:DUF4350 domain-containing protein n=1 Tax=Sphingobacterium sp. UT-1RO-CII-1 TaxID=2995225 RepID=UPI00227BFBFF|nr:DUF4350 domain-containing protein [Sphingobacterium sp. UT-1RO-CII-1]MCY4780730.1 Gldg family protein [Sphingobacterium sp. UT-1RO-CII-1]
MRKIIKIARLELSILFYSPIAWIILGIIFVQCGLNYWDTLYQQETQQQLERPLVVVTRVLFAGENGMLMALIENLYLYIPILTMGLLSREYTSGSIKLLQSSPVTSLQIVLGKFLSIMVYGALVVSLLSLYLVSAYFSVEQLDLKFLLFGLLGLYLLLCAYAAVGLLMSSLTSYQIVAAISTLALLAFFNYAQVVGQNYDGLREITYWLAIGGRTEDLVNGLLKSSDIIYFVLITVFFLVVAVMQMEFTRKATPHFKRVFSFVVLFFLLLSIGYISSLPKFNMYYDTTRIKDRTISVTGQELAKSIEGPIKLTSFVNVLDDRAGFGSSKNRIADVQRFQSFIRFIPHMEIEYIAYYDSVPYLRLDSGETIVMAAKKKAKALGFNFEKLKTPEQMKEYPEVAKEENSFVRFLKYDGKQTALRMYDDMLQYPGESEVLAALKRLKVGPAKLGILVGQGERGIENYTDRDYTVLLNGQRVRGSVINQGFEVNALRFSDLNSFSGAGLIVSDPQKAYTPEQITILKQYIDQGGNLMLLADPGSTLSFKEILEYLGLAYKDGTLLQKSADFDADLLQLQFTRDAIENGYKFYDGAKVVMKGAAAIKIVAEKGYQITPLFVTNPTNTWNKTGAFDLEKEKVTFDSVVDVRAQEITAVKMERQRNGRNQKIIVSGDADFMSNAEMSRYNISTVNSSFAMRSFKWFSDGEYPIGGIKEKAPDTLIKVSRKNINFQKITFLGIIPMLLAGFAFITLKKRRSK